MNGLSGGYDPRVAYAYEHSTDWDTLIAGEPKGDSVP
jgi:predicted ABC-type transport system involved in lysophospholipase L1 biosynthesis ATPase subunit